MRGLLSIEASWPANHQTAVTSRQTHRCTQPFTPFGAAWRFAAALWRRLVAPLGLPSSAGCASRWDHCRPVRHLLCWSHRLSPQPSDGSAPAGVMAEPARLSILSALHSASGLPSLCAGSRCVAGGSSQRCTTLTLYFAALSYSVYRSSLWSVSDHSTSHWTSRAF